MEDVPYRNACGHSDRENAVIEGNAAIRRAILGSSDLELIRLYSDVLVFRQRLHREIIDETYPRLHEMLRPLSQDDIDDAIRAWNGDIQSKHAVVRYMEKHGREKDTAAWLAQEYSGSDSKSLFVIRAGSPEGIELPWPKVQRRIAQLIKEDRFYTEAEQDRFDNIDPIAIREALAERGIVNGELVDEEKLDNDPFIQRVMADVEQIAAEEQEQSNQPLSDAEYARHNLIPGETTFALDGRTFRVSKLEPDVGRVELQDVTFANAVGFPIFRVEPISVIRQHLEQEPEPPTPATEPEKTLDEVLDEHPVSIQVNGEWQTFPNVKAAEEASYEEYKANLRRSAENFHITDDHLGEGGPKAKFQANVEAIKLLKYLEETTGQATPEQQKILSRYVGWGGLADAFDPDKESWSKEYAQLKELLTRSEYAAARGSTLNAHYTSPTVIKAIYEAVGRMGFETGNILEPSCGVGNFFGMLPEEMRNSRLYGVELDSISGRIAQQLYPKADITVAGFETTDRRDFYDLAVGNVPFGQYQVRDKAYDKLNFSIHNYFFAKALDQVRPGGVVAFVTSRYTMDAKDSTVRRYLAQRAELLGAIRLPNDAFKKNAGAEVVSDIIFLQKRDRPLDIVPEWTQTGQTEDGFSINRYFLDHPEMVLGRQEPESTAHGMDYTVNPIEGLELADQLHDAVKYIRGTYQEAELPELGEGEAIDTSIPADPNVKNYSYTVVDGAVYFRENSRMVRPDLNATAEARIKGMVRLRDCVQELIDLQMDAATPDSDIREKQVELNQLYDDFSAKYGLINDRGNRLAFADDSSYYLLCALEVIDENGQLKSSAADGYRSIFTGLVYCADCGFKMRNQVERFTYKDGTPGRYSSFICGNYSRSGKGACTIHTIYENVLTQLVLEDIREKARFAEYDPEQLVRQIIRLKDKEAKSRLSSCEQELKTYTARLSELERLMQNLYEDKCAGTIPQTVFQTLMHKYEAERAEKSEAIPELERKVKSYLENRTDANRWLTMIRRYTEITELDESILFELVDRIEVGETQKINGQRVCDLRVYYRYVGNVDAALVQEEGRQPLEEAI